MWTSCANYSRLMSIYEMVMEQEDIQLSHSAYSISCWEGGVL